jgi:hypothetical protein
VQPRHLEKPRFAVLGEVAYLPDVEAWDVRALMAIGVSGVFVGAGVSLHHEDEVALVIPVELSVPVLLTDSLRSPVAQIYLRADVAVTGGDDQHDRAFVGVRFGFDIL